MKRTTFLFLITFCSCPSAFAQKTNDEMLNNISTYTTSETFNDANGIILRPAATQTIQNTLPYESTMQRVIKAISQRSYAEAIDCFTPNGLVIFNRLVGYGIGNIVGTPDLHYYKSNNDAVTVRGLQMSFTLNRATKTEIVEDVVFSLDATGKVCNVALGLGDNFDYGILNGEHGSWPYLERETLVEFIENYKTAYCLGRLDYLRTQISDTTLILVEHSDSVENRANDAYSTKQYTTDEYFDVLSSYFKSTGSLSIRLTQINIYSLEKFEGNVYGIQLFQDNQTPTDSFSGYHFLMVNFDNPDQPLIKICTWQENPDPNFGWYNAGDFYDK